MKFERIRPLLTIVCFRGLFILFLLFFIGTLVVGLSGNIDDNVKEVKCYDRHSNEIKGLICEERMVCSKIPYVTFLKECK